MKVGLDYVNRIFLYVLDIEYFLKSCEISMIFLLRNAISPDPLVRFRWFFLQTADNFILFTITKNRVSDIFKFSKKIQNRDFWSEKPPNWQNCKFLTLPKEMNIIFGIIDPKLVKKHTSQSLPFFLVPCVIENPQNLAGDMYFFVIQAQSFTEAKKKIIPPSPSIWFQKTHKYTHALKAFLTVWMWN